MLDFDPKPATPDDVARYGAHLERVINASGVDGHVVFTPRTAGNFVFEPLRAKTTAAAWAKPLTAPGWQRTWYLAHEGRIVGHVDLHGGFTESMLHRATLGTSLERQWQGRGTGRKLTEHAIAWARTQPLLAWIDLKVYESNERAVALYQKLGFVTCGRLEDAARFPSGSYTDLSMALRL